MIFRFNERGDIVVDLENGTVCNEILGDKVESDFNTSKTTILTYFKHNNMLKNTFFKNKRNTLTDQEIRKYFDEHLKVSFAHRPDLLQFIKYEYVNDSSSFQVLFFFYSSALKRIILDYDLEI
ncbi:MAG: hypothetical protein ACRCXX_14240 [Cetobacterium sp.]|uniref:hypothetical protein n=1 Tax=Cetobacterium sp. TaxID=2071632 RepID=UPI003F34A488